MSGIIRWLCSGLTVMAVYTLSSCPSAWAGDKVELWQSRGQFVALEKQDSDTDLPAPLNDHPLEISAERLSSLLGAIDLRTAGGTEAVPLFTANALQLLTPQLRKGLSQAGMGEDVTFAVIGLHDALLGLTRQPRVTTGRLFYMNGRLNLIVGLAQQDVAERDDRRLKPFTPGSRRKLPADGRWELAQRAGQQQFFLKRPDWVVFDREQLTAPLPAKVLEQTPAAAAIVDTPTSADKRSPAERLTTLNELKDKGLISDEEFRAKRLEILNGL